jgi:hypothetical protein
MATTTAKAFDAFKDKLALTEAQKQLVSERYSTVASHLRSAFPSSSVLPLYKTKLIGSAGRGTTIRPIVDIDLFAEFTNRDNVFEQYRFDSQSFIYRIRDALKAHSTVEVVGVRGQAVRFFYANAPHVDVAPVFKWNGDGYALPNGAGGWLTTDPYAHDAYFSGRNEALSDFHKPLVTMLKRWNACHSGYFKSFHLEVVAGTVFASLGNNSRDACEKFFAWAQGNLRVSDPAGHSGDLSTYLTDNNRASLVSNLEAARQRASAANSAELSGNHQEAIRLWRIVFGDEFPAFG